MIKTKFEMKAYLKQDFSRIPDLSRGEKIFKEFNFFRRKLLKYLRLCEYLKTLLLSHPHNMFFKIRYFFVHKNFTKLSNKLNIVIPLFSCGPGLVLCHQNIIVNGKVGNNATFHGNNCLGEKDGGTPIIGNDADIGYGSTIIGNIKIGNNVIVGSNAFINKDCNDNAIVISKNIMVDLQNEND